MRIALLKARPGARVKSWCRCVLLDGRRDFLPGFDELFYMLQYIGLAEQERYNLPHHRGAFKVSDFARLATARFPTSDGERMKMCKKILADLEVPPKIIQVERSSSACSMCSGAGALSRWIEGRGPKDELCPACNGSGGGAVDADREK